MTADIQLESGTGSEEKVLSFTGELGLFRDRIKEYLEKSDKDPNINEDDLHLTRIREAIDNLDPEFPRFSQLRLIETLLKESEAQENPLHLFHEIERAPVMPLDFEDSSWMKHGESETNWEDFLEKSLTWARLVHFEIHFLTSNNAPVKTGNDCNAPLVVAN